MNKARLTHLFIALSVSFGILICSVLILTFITFGIEGDSPDAAHKMLANKAGAIGIMITISVIVAWLITYWFLLPKRKKI